MNYFDKRLNVAGIMEYKALNMFKILLLHLWYNLRDREMDDALLERHFFRSFARFRLKENTPCYTTICRFRNKLVQLKLDEKIFTLVKQFLKGWINNKGAIVFVDKGYVSQNNRKYLSKHG